MDNTDFLDRNALILYLQNVRDLEVALHGISNRFYEEKNRYNTSVRGLKPTARTFIHEVKPNPSKRDEALRRLKIYSLCEIVLFAFLIIIVTAGSSMIGTVLVIGSMPFICVVTAHEFVIENREYKSLYSEWEKRENSINIMVLEERARADRDWKKKQALDSRWNQQSQFYLQQYNSAESLLNSFYSMNILPVQYRNLPAICYIYDYLSTSRETLTAALFSRQIDDGISRIEAKLGEIVDKLEEQIYETRCLRDEAHRSNQQMIERNTQMLDSLRQTERNTERAAQYAELGAHYSEANAFFSLATYLKTNQ